jgi:glucose 1-dehydrogenase
MRLEGKAALVTGASSGIGRAIAERFIREGADVAVHYRGEADAAAAVVEGARAAGRRAVAVQADASDLGAVRRMVADAISGLGRIDILVNSAGLEIREGFLDVSEEHWDLVLDVNLKGAFFAMQAVARHLVERKVPGRLVNISSIHEDVAFLGFAPYAASKGGLRMATRTIAQTLAPHGITVNDIAPGAIATPINERTLATGDLIRIGSHIFKFLSNDVEAQYHQTIFSMIVTDGLTGIFSRRFFEEALEREVVRSQRHRRPLALVMFDIDKFKSVNDEHSHLVGNEVLREVCRRIAPSIRRDEVFARWGGEEFVVLLPEAQRQQAAAFAERLRKLVADEPIAVGSVELPITISLGVGSMEGEISMDGNGLVLDADRIDPADIAVVVRSVAEHHAAAAIILAGQRFLRDRLIVHAQIVQRHEQRF